MTGFVTSVEYAGGGRIQYIAKGPELRMETELDTNVYVDGLAIGGASGAIQSVLANMATRIDDTTTDNIATNTSTLLGANPKFPEGSYPAPFIKQILDLSDASNNIYDFWLVDQVFNGTYLQKWTPHYKARETDAAIDWQINIDDTSDMTLSRNIDNVITDSEVLYGRVTGSHDGTSPITTPFTDSTADFLAAGVTPGDSITNATDGSRGQVEAVTATTITPTSMSGGTGTNPDQFTTGDFVSITMKNISKSQTAATTATYWKQETAVTESGMTSAQASTYATTILEAGATQVQAFTVTAPTIRDGNGARWPLWEVIAQGGGYIRVNDLFPAAAIFGESNNSLTVFRITALDYDYTSNTLRINVDNQDRRLDVRLRRFGIVNSESINRG